jgi:hypothetical protein
MRRGSPSLLSRFLSQFPAHWLAPSQRWLLLLLFVVLSFDRPRHPRPLCGRYALGRPRTLLWLKSQRLFASPDALTTCFFSPRPRPLISPFPPSVLRTGGGDS